MQSDHMDSMVQSCMKYVVFMCVQVLSDRVQYYEQNDHTDAHVSIYLTCVHIPGPESILGSSALHRPASRSSDFALYRSLHVSSASVHDESPYSADEHTLTQQRRDVYASQSGSPGPVYPSIHSHADRRRLRGGEQSTSSGGIVQ